MLLYRGTIWFRLRDCLYSGCGGIRINHILFRCHNLPDVYLHISDALCSIASIIRYFVLSSNFARRLRPFCLRYSLTGKQSHIIRVVRLRARTYYPNTYCGYIRVESSQLATQATELPYTTRTSTSIPILDISRLSEPH